MEKEKIKSIVKYICIFSLLKLLETELSIPKNKPKCTIKIEILEKCGI